MLAVRYEAARGDFERVLKQRNALLRSGVRDPSAVATLDVLDEQLVRAGGELVRGRLQLVDRLGPAVERGVRGAGRRRPARSPRRYEAEWSPEPLGDRRRRRGRGAAARRGRRAAPGRDRAGRDARRPAPRRLEADDRGPRRRARRRRRASSGASRWRCAWPAGAWCTSSPGRRPCCCSTTCSASSTPRRSSALDPQPAGRPDAAHDGRRDPGRRASPIRCCGSTRAASSGRPGRAVSRHAADEPVPLRDAVAAVGRHARDARARRVREALPTRGRRSSASTLAPARVGAVAPRRRVHRGGRRTGLGDAAAVRRAASSWSAAEECCGPGVVTSIPRVVVERPVSTRR